MTRAAAPSLPWRHRRLLSADELDMLASCTEQLLDMDQWISGSVYLWIYGAMDGVYREPRKGGATACRRIALVAVGEKGPGPPLCEGRQGGSSSSWLSRSSRSLWREASRKGSPLVPLCLCVYFSLSFSVASLSLGYRSEDAHRPTARQAGLSSPARRRKVCWFVCLFVCLAW